MRICGTTSTWKSWNWPNRLSGMTAQPVLLDCDPGIDDALALIYLAALHRAGEIELVGVTTTAGNVGIDQTTRNASYLLQLCGLDEVPVAAGFPEPSQVELVTTPETHGPSGLGYLSVPEEQAASEPSEWTGIWTDAASRAAHLIVTGPLTNAAYFAAANAADYASFADVTVMGGAINYPGNTTPTAEWNFWVDPHAARDVFASATRPITLCPLNVTETMLIGPTQLERLREALAQHPVSDVLPEMMRFYFEFHEAHGSGYQAQIHDLLTCMVALQNAPFLSTSTTVRVVSEPEWLRGTSVADLRGHWGQHPNATLVTVVDVDSAHREFLRAAKILALPENL